MLESEIETNVVGTVTVVGLDCYRLRCGNTGQAMPPTTRSRRKVVDFSFALLLVLLFAVGFVSLQQMSKNAIGAVQTFRREVASRD